MFTCSLLKLKGGAKNRSFLSYIDPDYRLSEYLSVHNINKSILNSRGRIFVFHKKTRLSWLSELDKFLKISISDNLFNSYYSALIIFEIKNKRYAISYGKGSTLLKPNCIDTSFVRLVSREFLLNNNSGRLTYMNQAHIFSNSPLKYEINSLLKSDIPDNKKILNHEPFVLKSFRTKGLINFENNLGNTVRFDLTLASKTSLDIKIDKFDLKYLVDLISYFENSINSSTEKSFDNEILEEKNTSESFKKLNDKLHKLCVTYKKKNSLDLKSLRNLSMLEPDKNCYYLISKVAVFNKNKFQDFNNFDVWEHIVSSINKSQTDDIIDFIEKSVVSKFDDSGKLLSKKSLLKYINYHYSDPLSKNIYFLSNGSWYKIESDYYLNNIVDSVSKIPRINPKKFSFVNMTKQDRILNKQNKMSYSENEYTKRIFEQILSKKQKDWLLMDKETIAVKHSMINNRGSIEVADLLLIEQDYVNFFCLKPGSSGNGFSHLINQSSNAILSLKGDFFNDFLNEINGQLADQGRDKLSKSDFQNKKKKVILSLILDEKSTRQKDFTKIFPIMSIISLYNLKTILDYENCELEIMFIAKEEN